MLAVLVGLGTWQVQRLHWKEGVIALRAAGLAAAPLTVDAVPSDPAEVEFRRIRVSGTLLHDREMQLLARTYRRAAGVHVVTPLRLADGAIVLVDRGWVPRSRRDPASRTLGQVGGRVEITGILRTGGRTSPWIPDNDPQANTWHYIDVAAMAARSGLAPVKPFVIEAGPAANPGGLPIGGRTRFRLPNDHLQYAITWYALAAALMAIYVLYHRRQAGRPRG